MYLCCETIDNYTRGRTFNAAHDLEARRAWWEISKHRPGEYIRETFDSFPAACAAWDAAGEWIREGMA